jgi:ABC-type transport system substrate-binding protein
MNSKRSTLFVLAVILTMLASIALVGCGPQATTPPQEVPTTEAQPVEQPTEPPKAEPVVNRAGVTLPADAAPLDQQVMRYAEKEVTWQTWDASVYDENVGDMFAWADSCVRPDEFYEPQPNACTSWEVSDDGLTWTFHLQQDKKWSDGVPITADDWVFTLQRFTRPDYDFEWFYSMANIVNWSDVVNGKVPPEELGTKKVDDYTFTVTTDRPTPYLIKIFADLWVVPKHIVKDRLDDGSWAFKPENQVFAGPYKLESWTKGKEMVFVANDMYTGPFPPMMDKIIVNFMDAGVRWSAYKNNELDAIGGGYENDLPPSAMAEIMANPELQKQLISWPNFITYYLFFDTWNPPFDNLKVRQAFSHAIDRDALVNGPLQYQAVPAYTMNPPGFPGESVDQLKGIQNYDPALAAQLIAEAGYPNGEGFPKLTLYTRAAYPALTNAAEGMAAMIKENLGITVEVQDLEYSIFSEGYRNQKANKSGNFIFAMVPYEFDFVDGSNLLSVWGGCEDPGTDLSQMPGRHTWYNQEYNNLLCEAGSILNDEPKRNQLYQQAEKILISDVALVPIYHGIFVAMVKPDIKGPMLEPGKDGIVTWMRHRFSSRESLIYRAATP